MCLSKDAQERQVSLLNPRRKDAVPLQVSVPAPALVDDGQPTTLFWSPARTHIIAPLRSLRKNYESGRTINLLETQGKKMRFLSLTGPREKPRLYIRL